MPPVRLAPRDELAAAARVAPLLRAAVDLSAWADVAAAVAGEAPPADAPAPRPSSSSRRTSWTRPGGWSWPPAGARTRSPGTARLANCRTTGRTGRVGRRAGRLLDAEELDGLATALYTVGAPVRIDALFEAYSAAAGGAPRPEQGGRPAEAGRRWRRRPGRAER